MNDVIATVMHDFSKEMLQWKRMFQVFQRYVAIVSYRCCKSRSGMLHILQVFHRYVEIVTYGYCKSRSVMLDILQVF